MKKRNVYKIKNNKGITLIVLVVTILLIIILAGISLSLLFGKYGIIARAKEQQEIQTKVEILQELELQKGQVTIDGNGYTGLDKYLEYLDEHGLNNNEVTNREKYNDVTEILTIDGKYIYTAAQIENNVVINEIGNIEKLKPEIISFNITGKTTNSIEIEITARMVGKYKFYIKKEDENKYIEVGEIEGNNRLNYDKETKIYEYKNLTQNETYNIKVIVENDNGEIETKEKSVTLDIIPTPIITVADPDTWTNGTKTITISEASGYTTRYTTDGTIPSETNGTTYTGVFTVSSNCTITAVYLDNTNQIGSATTNTITKIDTVAPGQAKITTSNCTSNVYTTTATVNLTASATDSYGEIDHYEFTINGGSSVASTSNPYAITDTYCSKTVYARAVDKAGNVGAWSAAFIVKKGKTLASVASAGQLVSYNGANWRIYTNNGSTIVLAGHALSNVTLSGYSHWANCVTNLNNIAVNYQLNTTYATSARSINYNDNLSLLVSWGFKGYWLATTHGPSSNGVLTYYGVNMIDSNGNYGYETQYENIYVTHTNGATADQPFTYHVAALVSLKSGIITSGTSGGVWQLVAP